MTRIGIVGAGFMGSTHAAAWDRIDGAQLVGVTAAADTPATDLASRYGARAHPDLDKLLAEVDVVDICAPTHLHESMTLAAARSGTNVICEKPLARTSGQADRMIAACRDAGVALLVAQVVRFFPEYAAARDQVARGGIGDPAVLRLGRSTFQPRKPAGNWFLDEEKSGGLVFDLMVHDIDYARWVAGDVDSVLARGVRAARPDAPVDHVVAVLHHTNGVLSHVEASWAHPPPTFRTRGEIAGTTGVASWDSDRSEPVRVRLRDTLEAGDVPLAGSTLVEDPYTTQLRHFLDVLRGEQATIVTAEDGAAAVRVAEAVVASCASGEVVTVDGVERASDRTVTEVGA